MKEININKYHPRRMIITDINKNKKNIITNTKNNDDCEILSSINDDNRISVIDVCESRILRPLYWQCYPDSNKQIINNYKDNNINGSSTNANLLKDELSDFLTKDFGKRNYCTMQQFFDKVGLYHYRGGIYE